MITVANTICFRFSPVANEKAIVTFVVFNVLWYLSATEVKNLPKPVADKTGTTWAVP